MKNCLLFFCMFMLFTITSVNGQNPFNPNAIVGKKLFIDHHSLQSERFSEFDKFTHGFELGYVRNISRFVNIGFPLKVGVINLPPDETGNTNIDDNLTMLGLDGVVQLQWWRKKNFIVPYAMAGVGFSMEDFEKTNFEVPMGIGINARLFPNIYLNIQSEFRYSMAENRSNFHHGIGLMYLLGKTDAMSPEDAADLLAKDLQPDADGDGIPDDADVCPDIAGLAVFLGCPDTDSDGIADKDDDCPEEAGSPVTGGCPDTDGDGVADTEDECPEEVGSLAHKGCPLEMADSTGTLEGGPDNDGDGVPNAEDECPDAAGSVKGCPDTDADGVPDKDDACPQLAGKVELRGCLDSDGDGIIDSEDRCSTIAGVPSNGGCPESASTVTSATRATLESAMHMVQFNFASATLKEESYAILDQIADIVLSYPDHYLNITGHTDDVGSERNNFKLSVKRAEACHDYLMSKGIDKYRLSYGGYGEASPVTDNDTEDGRAMNRRTEFILYKR